MARSQRKGVSFKENMVFGLFVLFFLFFFFFFLRILSKEYGKYFDQLSLRP